MTKLKSYELDALFAQAKDATEYAQRSIEKGKRYHRLHSVRADCSNNAITAYERAVKAKDQIIAALVAQLQGQ